MKYDVTTNPDAQEAESIKYISARVAILSSGKFSVYWPWSQESGLPLERICDAEELPEILRMIQEQGRITYSKVRAKPLPDPAKRVLTLEDLF